MKALLTLVLSLFVASPAIDLKFQACTKSHEVVSVRILVDEDVATVHQDLSAHVQAAFLKVAASMDTDVLMSQEGFKAFVAALDDADRAGLVDVYQPQPVEGVKCVVVE